MKISHALKPDRVLLRKIDASGPHTLSWANADGTRRTGARRCLEKPIVTTVRAPHQGSRAGSVLNDPGLNIPKSAKQETTWL